MLLLLLYHSKDVTDLNVIAYYNTVYCISYIIIIIIITVPHYAVRRNSIFRYLFICSLLYAHYN